MLQYANKGFDEKYDSERHERLQRKAWQFLRYVLGPELYGQLKRRGYIEVGDFILSTNGHLYGLEQGRVRGYGLLTRFDLRGDHLVSLYLWAKSQPNKIKSIACYATPPAPSEVSSAFQARVVRLLQELMEAAQETSQSDEESLQIYRREIARIRPLSKEEELKLARRASSGDKQACEKLIAANLKLVISVAERYQGRGLPLADLIQEGNIGLVEALHKFNYTKGYRFGAYAYWWVLNAIQRAVGEHSVTLEVPAHAVEGLRDVELLDGKYVLMASLDRLQNDAQESSAERLQDDKRWFEEDKPKPSRVELLRRALDRLELTPKEREILKLRFGLNGDRPHTLKEVARVFNITRERVRQIELRTIEKLRHPSRRQQLQRLSCEF